MKTWIEKGLEGINFTIDENGIGTLKGEELERVKERWEYYEKKQRHLRTALIIGLGIFTIFICIFLIRTY